ncbi:MAG: patatin-like phospholipase family protein [Bacteroidia bacterium]
MNYNFKNLVFEGGGVKGIAYGGALEVLNSMNIIPGIQRVAGTSAGAINATLLALGYTSDEVSKIIAETNFKDFEDGNIVSEVIGVTKKYGWYKGDKFKDWLGKYIKAKTGNADITFREFALQAKAKGFRQLYVVSTNLTRQQALIFSHEPAHFLDTQIKDAVRMSMSIPLYFQAVTKDNDIWVDGGVSWNYPVNIFDNNAYITKPENAEKVIYNTDPGYIFNHETLGFRLDSTQVIEYNKDNWKNEPVEINNIKDYALGLVNFLMEMANKKHLHQNDWNRTIFIDTLDVKTTDFKLPPEKIRALLASGRTGVTDYFKWRDGDPVWNKLPV